MDAADKKPFAGDNRKSNCRLSVSVLTLPKIYVKILSGNLNALKNDQI